ncbi:hypothetical protein quinque_016157 [Culex quinquefasciatus]
MFSYHISAKTRNHILSDCCRPSPVPTCRVWYCYFRWTHLMLFHHKRYKQYIFGSQRSKDYGAQHQIFYDAAKQVLLVRWQSRHEL